MLQTRRHFLTQVAATAIAIPFPVVAKSNAAMLEPTPNEIVGPFYPINKPDDSDFDMAHVSGKAGHAHGRIIEVSGRILDLRGRAAPDTRVEIWQANAAGRYQHPSDTNTAPLAPQFQGYAALKTDAEGRYRITTIKPGPYPGGRRGMRAPHIHFDITGRIDRLVTQMYFPDDPFNANDALLQANIRPAMVIAKPEKISASGVDRFQWDIILRTG
jgi:protocatechuate 3,4-dioxygenase beta subunit